MLFNLMKINGNKIFIIINNWNFTFDISLKTIFFYEDWNFEGFDFCLEMKNNPKSIIVNDY